MPIPTAPNSGRVSRRIPKSLVSLITVASLGVGGLFVLGALRRWNDPQHCWGWTPFKQLDASGNPLPMSEQPWSFRAAVERCIEQRRAHRSGPFGAFVTREGRAALSCERRWGQFQELIAQDHPAESLPVSYAIRDRLDPSSLAHKERFMEACVPIRTRELRDLGSD